MEYIDTKWTICDGDGHKPSTNGTWLFVDNPIKITNRMIFKAGQLEFITKITNGDPL